MKKKKLVSLVVAMAAFLIMSITALAATCPVCEQCHQVVNLISRGEHLWHYTTYHTVDYSDEYGKLCHETCEIGKSEDKLWWECPNGHGSFQTQIHRREIHSSKYCNSLDYYYTAN